MVDWVGHDGMPTSRRYQEMAERQLPGISPSYAALCTGVANDPVVLDRLDTLPAEKRQPNLLLGAVRYLSGPVDAYDAFREFVLDEWDAVSGVMRARRTQTNEPRRCTALLPVLAALPQPIALLEVGAAAGLCLYPDRYAYRYGEVSLGSGPLELACAVRGPVPLPLPLPALLPKVVWRAGLDLNPLDVRAEDDVRWLRALIWPEQTERFAILDAAVEVAHADPVEIHRGDLTTDVAQVAAGAPADAVLVVFHSAVLAYLDDAGRAAFRASLDALAATRPLVWLANEGPGVAVEYDLPGDRPIPFVVSRDGTPLALASPHGDWLEWLG